MRQRRLAVTFLVLTMSVATMSAAEEARKPWLGMALQLKKAPDGGRFLYVAHAPEGAPAAAAGVRPGDLIVRIDGKPIAFRDDVEILEFSSALTPGKLLKLRVVRGGKEHDIKVRIGILPVEYEPLVAESLRKAREARARAKQ